MNAIRTKKTMKAITLLRDLESSCSQTWAAVSALLLVTAAASSLGQGTVTFGARPFFSGTDYSELGLRFRTVIPPGSSGYDNMVIVGPIPPGGSAPENSTPYMGWFRQFNPENYVQFSLTNSYTFGLMSVALADPNSPSSSLLPISFVGWKAGGLSVTNTFTTPGNGATAFENYIFTPDFASGLTSVDILAPRWAMDNLVYVIPEPSAAALSFIGLLAWAVGRSFTGHQSPSPRTARVRAVCAGQDLAG